MLEAQKRCVQRLASETGERGLRALAEPRGLGLEPCAVDRITEEGVTDRRHVDTDLMRAPGLETAGDEACRAERLHEPPMGQGVPAARLIGDRHLFPMARMSADRCRHLAGPRFKAAPNQREVLSFERAG